MSPLIFFQCLIPFVQAQIDVLLPLTSTTFVVSRGHFNGAFVKLVIFVRNRSPKTLQGLASTVYIIFGDFKESLAKSFIFLSSPIYAFL